MTMDERVAIAAQELERISQDWTAGFPVETATQVLMKAFPELHGDKPTHWLAPWAVTNEMIDAAIQSNVHIPWNAMRDAYLGKGDGE